MTSRSQTKNFPTFALRSSSASVRRSTAEARRERRFCPDWALCDDNSDFIGGVAPPTTLDEQARDVEELSRALERYRLMHRRQIVSCEEALAIFKSLGYRKPGRTERAERANRAK